MDTDSNDGTTGESLNGETKPDPAKLAQTAIIKQDVMLSGTSTQSPLAPVSSVFTMPSVSMPSVSNSTALGLPDHFFMSVPSVADTATASAAHDRPDSNGTIPGLANPSHLLGQPQVAPQFFIASHPSSGLASSASAAASSALGVQQLLIPVSTGNGTQQFISIPVSMATGGNQQIQLLTTSNGQIIATNLASLQALAQPLNLNVGGSAGGAASHSSHGNSSSSNHSSASSHSGSNHGLAGQIAIPQLLTTGAQGQLLAVTPQMISSVSQLKSAASSHRQVLSPLSVTQANSSSSSSSSNSHQSSGGSSSGTANAASSSLQQAIVGAAHTPVIAHASAAHSPAISSAQVASNGLPPSVSQLLPNTVGNCTESTTVDGINLDEIKEFARQFKIRRLSLGLTQTQVGQALSATEGPAYSQSAICRFEKLDITPKSAQKIKPVLERWMAEAEERYKNGVQNLTEFIGSEPSKKRKRRTSFTPQALEVLNQYFERNTHPSGAEMTELSEKLSYDREVIRVWFCNKRQALKNTIKKLKQEGQ